MVVRRVEAYVAGSRNLDPAIGEKWRAVFQQMVRDGTYARLLQQYPFVMPEPLPCALPAAAGRSPDPGASRASAKTQGSAR